MGRDINIFRLAEWGRRILIVIALAVLAYDTAAPYLALRPIPTDGKINLVLLLVAGHLLDAQLLASNKGRRFLDRGPAEHFIRALFKYIDSVESGMEAKTITIRGKVEAVNTLTRMCDAAAKKYQGLNYYAGDWKNEMGDVFDANIRARGRKVKVERYFVIMDQIAHHSERLDELISVMEEQHAAGIRVFFCLESEIRRSNGFQKHFLRGTSLYDDKLLIYDIFSDPMGPEEICVTWDATQIHERNPFTFMAACSATRRWPQERERLKLSSAPPAPASTTAART